MVKHCSKILSPPNVPCSLCSHKHICIFVCFPVMSGFVLLGAFAPSEIFEMNKLIGVK